MRSLLEDREVGVGGPSLRFTTVGLVGDMPTTRTEYICGLNTRFESRSCSGHEYGPLRAYIQNRDLSYRFELDLAKCIYTASQVNEHDGLTWVKSRQAEPQKRSGRTVHIHMETIDTGERKERFAYTSRRVITKSRQTRDSQWLSEWECDGWYIDPPAAWLNLHPPAKPGTFYHVHSGTGERDDYKFSQAGKRETGFPVLTTQRDKSYFPDETGNSGVHETVHHQEITELSETPLEPDLFVPPSDFRRVPQLPDSIRYGQAHRIRLRWEMFKDSLTLPNRITKFIATTSAGLE